MKIRSDFVSNSSSSSFIISTRMSFSDMRNSILNYQKEDDIRENNTCAVDYFLNYYNLLFLGYIPLFTETINKGTDFEFEENISSFDIMVKRDDFDYWLHYKEWYKDGDEFDGCRKEPEVMSIDEARKEFKKQFMEIVMQRSKCSSFIPEFEMCSITQDTIKMTEAIIDCGINLIYDKDEFEAIKKALDEGKSVYYITMGDSGEGMNPERIYISRRTGINAHDPKEFKKIVDCDIITKEDKEEIPE